MWGKIHIYQLAHLGAVGKLAKFGKLGNNCVEYGVSILMHACGFGFRAVDAACCYSVGVEMCELSSGKVSL